MRGNSLNPYLQQLRQHLVSAPAILSSTTSTSNATSSSPIMSAMISVNSDQINKVSDAGPMLPADVLTPVAMRNSVFTFGAASNPLSVTSASLN